MTNKTISVPVMTEDRAREIGRSKGYFSGVTGAYDVHWLGALRAVGLIVGSTLKTSPPEPAAPEWGAPIDAIKESLRDPARDRLTRYVIWRRAIDDRKEASIEKSPYADGMNGLLTDLASVLGL